MTSFVVTWGVGKRQPITTVAELDAVLDEIAALGAPYSVGIWRPEDLDNPASPWDAPPVGSLEIGMGHPDRSFVLFMGEDGGEAVEEMPAWPAGQPDIAFDYGGQPVYAGEDRARVRPETARRAAREFVATGERPTCVSWVW